MQADVTKLFLARHDALAVLMLPMKVEEAAGVAARRLFQEIERTAPRRAPE